MGRPTTIGDLLTERFHSGAEGAAMYASVAVAAANQALRSRWPERDATALSFSRGTLVVRVGHGAIAGHIKHQEQALLAECNQALEKRFPRLRYPATGIITRLSS